MPGEVVRGRARRAAAGGSRASGPGRARRSRQRRSGERGASASQCAPGSAASARPNVGRGSPRPAARRRARRPRRRARPRPRAASSWRSNGDSAEQRARAGRPPARSVRLRLGRRRRGLAVAVRLEQRADVLHLGHERRLLALGAGGARRPRVMPAPPRTATGRSAGGSAERSTSRLSTPSTVSRTHCVARRHVAELEA